MQVLRLCREAGLARLGHVSLDGTKVRANASKHVGNEVVEFLLLLRGHELLDEYLQEPRLYALPASQQPKYAEAAFTSNRK